MSIGCNKKTHIQGSKQFFRSITSRIFGSGQYFLKYWPAGNPYPKYRTILPGKTDMIYYKMFFILIIYIYIWNAVPLAASVVKSCWIAASMFLHIPEGGRDQSVLGSNEPKQWSVWLYVDAPVIMNKYSQYLQRCKITEIFMSNLLLDRTQVRWIRGI